MAKDELISAIRENLSDTLTVSMMDKVLEACKKSMNDYEIERSRKSGGTFFKEFLDAFLDAKRVEGRSDKTIERYRYILMKLDSYLGIPIEDITVFHLRKYFGDMKSNGWSDVTMEGIRSVFCSFFGWCHRESLIKQNPTANLGAIKCKKKVRIPYSPVDLEIMKTGCKNIRDQAIISLLYCSGMRVNEMCQLNIDSVNFDSRECIVLGKGNKERTVFLDEVTVMLLKKYLDSRNDNLEALFVGKGSDRLTPGGIRSILKGIESNLGLSNVHPHRFRRTFATGLINKGMPIQEVAAILGHERLDTTMKYVHVTKDNVKNDYGKYFGNV